MSADQILRLGIAEVVKAAPDTVNGRDPGDDLVHTCAAHEDGFICEMSKGHGCVSFCGIDMSGWTYIGDASGGGEAQDCVVCNAMWKAKP